MNLSNYAQPIVLFQSTGSDSTGVALTLSTAGSTGTGSFSSTPGGFPIASTGSFPAVSLLNADGVRFFAVGSAFSTAAPSLFTLQAYAAASSTSSSTTWVAIKDAYAVAYSTGGGPGVTGAQGIVVDVYRPNIFPTYTAVGAVVQFPTSSGGLVTCVADRYSLKSLPPANSTAAAGLGQTSTGRGNRVISVNGTT